MAYYALFGVCINSSTTQIFLSNFFQKKDFHNVLLGENIDIVSIDEGIIKKIMIYALKISTVQIQIFNSKIKDVFGKM